MSDLTTPDYLKFDDTQQSVYLRFQEKTPFKDGDYFMRIGIAFPEITETGLRGHICIAGKHIESGVIYIFRDMEFFTVDDVLDNDGVPVHRGIARWLNNIWNDFQSRKIMYSAYGHEMIKYRVAFRESPLLISRPILIEEDVRKPEQSMHIIYELDMINKLKYSKSSLINEEIQKYKKDPTKIYPALTAARIVVNKLSRMRKRV